VVLRRLRPEDAEPYTTLLRKNRAHLTRLGDYEDEVETTATEYAHQFSVSGPALAFGIYEAGAMVGSIALVPVQPPRYGIGYWLAEEACGRGLATLALEALLAYAEGQLSATDVFAGVTHGNDKSVAVLQRAGFELSADFEHYSPYRLGLAGAGASSGLSRARIGHPPTAMPAHGQRYEGPFQRAGHC
jgi:RimJ/RimL family protein N-acetyltransferase